MTPILATKPVFTLIRRMSIWFLTTPLGKKFICFKLVDAFDELLCQRFVFVSCVGVRSCMWEEHYIYYSLSYLSLCIYLYILILYII